MNLVKLVNYVSVITLLIGLKFICFRGAKSMS